MVLLRAIQVESGKVTPIQRTNGNRIRVPASINDFAGSTGQEDQRADDRWSQVTHVHIAFSVVQEKPAAAPASPCQVSRYPYPRYARKLMNPAHPLTANAHQAQRSPSRSGPAASQRYRIATAMSVPPKATRS